MIDLTPLEVRQKKGDFRRTLRGYDPELVNDFLDLVADRMEELVKENLGLRDSMESVREELSDYRRKEQALSEALMSAQKLREDARHQAERERDLMLREARLAAETLRQEASRQLVREEEALRQMKARRLQLVDSFRRLLEREIDELDVIQETLDLEGPASPPRVPEQQEGSQSAAQLSALAPEDQPPPVQEEAQEEAREEAREEAVPVTHDEPEPWDEQTSVPEARPTLTAAEEGWPTPAPGPEDAPPTPAPEPEDAPPTPAPGPEEGRSTPAPGPEDAPTVVPHEKPVWEPAPAPEEAASEESSSSGRPRPFEDASDFDDSLRIVPEELGPLDLPNERGAKDGTDRKDRSEDDQDDWLSTLMKE